jgi:alcohol dehydrogenase (cytochrome c)
LTLPAGANEATPLVHDGVIFVHSFGDNVQALDAATGDELWHYSRKLPDNVRPAVKKNMALYSNKLFVGTSDIHVVALDVKTGSVVWDQPIANATEEWQLTGGPLVAKGKVMQGIGGRVKGGAYIVGLDSETGKEAWRFHSIARPDEPGGDNWNGIPLDQRSGGSIWTAPSYDPALNLVFFGPAPTYDTGPLRNRVSAPGVTNDALYTNSTVALNPTPENWFGITNTCRTTSGISIGHSNAKSFRCAQPAGKRRNLWSRRANPAFMTLAKRTPASTPSPWIWDFRTS